MNIKEKGKVITLYPIVAGSGAKYTATNLAYYAKELNPDKSIALVDLNLKHPYLAHSLSEHDDIHGIDNLTDQIDGAFLNKELFLENMITLKNEVQLLKGTKQIGKHKIYKEEYADTIIQYLKDCYDYIFIAVATEPDNAGTIFGLSKADNVVAVVNNTISNRKSLERASTVISTYSGLIDKPKIVYNKYLSKGLDISEAVVGNGFEILGAIEYNSGSVDNNDLIENIGKKMFKRRPNEDVFTEILGALKI